MSIRIYTRVNDKLASWDTDHTDFGIAVEWVKHDLGAGHKHPVLCLITNDNYEKVVENVRA